MAKRNFQKKPLYRKVNTRARGVHHAIGPDYRHQRNTKAERSSEAVLGKMVQGRQRGLDYTPLFRFLLSKAGQPFDTVLSEARARLDREDPIWWLVARRPEDVRSVVRIGESAYFSGLHVDENGILRLVDPAINNADLWPNCACCTHTFNGELFVNGYDESRPFFGVERV